MLAARILGWPKYGLGHILEAYFDIIPNKRFQQYNWGKRPLSQAALEYARLDTHYLLTLRNIQQRELQQLGREAEAQDAFERITQARSVAKVFNPADFWHIKGAKSLQAKQQALLQALFVFRDRAARQANRPLFKIMNDSTMVRIALHRPRTMNGLKGLKGVGRPFLRRYGRKVLNLLKIPHPEADSYPKNNHPRPPESVLQRYERLRSWRNATARIRGVEPDVILSNDVLMAIARANPLSCAELESKKILGAWQFQTYAKTVIKALRGS